jgi:hypothetical protein
VTPIAVRAPAGTHEGFAARAARTPPPPLKLPSRKEYDQLSDEDRSSLNEERLTRIANLQTLRTSQFEKARSTCARIIGHNRRAITQDLMRGVVLDGPPDVGKTTALLQVGVDAWRAQNPTLRTERTEAGDLHIPVAYVSLPADTTIKGLNHAILRYYGGVAPRGTKDQLTGRVIDQMRRCGTTVLLLDDVHFLTSVRGRSHVSEHIKYLANKTSNTFVLAGVECEKAGVLDEWLASSQVAASQTRRRLYLVDLEPFSGVEGRNGPWLQILATLEQQLPLLGPTQGVLSTRLSKYIHRRTHGYMGALMELIRHGADAAINSGEETITKALLEEIPLDLASEIEANRRQR